jgi:hypothetical protein
MRIGMEEIRRFVAFSGGVSSPPRGMGALRNSYE